MLITLAVIGLFWIRQRRRRAGYSGVLGTDPYDGAEGRSLASGLGLDGHGSGSGRGGKWREQQRDVEAAREYDEAELDDLTDHRHKDMGGDSFGLADEDDEDEEDVGGRRANGHVR